MTYQNVKDDDTYAELIRFLMKIKAKLKKKRGPKARSRKKFFTLKDYGKFRKTQIT